jgi:hypothetical protein
LKSQPSSTLEAAASVAPVISRKYALGDDRKLAATSSVASSNPASERLVCGSSTQRRSSQVSSVGTPFCTRPRASAVFQQALAASGTTTSPIEKNDCAAWGARRGSSTPSIPSRTRIEVITIRRKRSRPNTREVSPVRDRCSPSPRATRYVSTASPTSIAPARGSSAKTAAR